MIEVVSLSLVPQLLHSYDTGVSTTRTRRRFTAAFKLKILEAAAQCTNPGELGALLRREGLYTSHLASWRAAARRGELAGLAQRRGPRPAEPDPSAKRLEIIVSLQKKVSQLLGLALPASDE